MNDPTSSSDALGALRVRVERLEAERDILRVVQSYGPALDYGDEEAWARCFTVDGVWETSGPGARRLHRLEGRDALLGFARQHTRAPDRLHKHCVFDSTIDIDGDAAQVVSYFVRLDAFAEGPAVFAFGRYHDRFVRDGGAWRIAHRRAEIESTGPRKP